MSNFPGPVHSDKADEAEARRQDLRSRFRAVSRGIDRRGGGFAGSDGGLSLSLFEIAMIVAGAAFFLWAAMRMFGAG